MMSRDGRQSNEDYRRFRSFFGVDPIHCTMVWTILDGYNFNGSRPNGMKPVHLLWALLFLKSYACDDILCALAGGVDKKTFRKWCWFFIRAVSSIEDDFVSLYHSMWLSFDHV